MAEFTIRCLIKKGCEAGQTTKVYHLELINIIQLGVDSKIKL